MTKKNAKTKSKKPKNQVATKASNLIKTMDDDLKIKLGLKGTVGLYYKNNEDGAKEIYFKNFEKTESSEEREGIINDFYSAFGVKNALITDTLLHNVNKHLNLTHHVRPILTHLLH